MDAPKNPAQTACSVLRGQRMQWQWSSVAWAEFVGLRTQQEQANIREFHHDRFDDMVAVLNLDW